VGASPSSATGGSVKAEGLGDGLTQGKAAIAKLRLTLPPSMSDDFAFTLIAEPGGLDKATRNHLSSLSVASPCPVSHEQKSRRRTINMR